MSICFAIMPISTPDDIAKLYGGDKSHFERVAEWIFKPAAEKAGFEFRAPRSASSEIIHAEIISSLGEAELVLCDISQLNANVFFELGIRTALNRPVVIVKDKITRRIPFDTSMLNCHTYDRSLDISVVHAEVPALAQHIESARDQQNNALWRFFGIRHKAEASIPENATDAKLDLIIDQLRWFGTRGEASGESWIDDVLAFRRPNLDPWRNPTYLGDDSVQNNPIASLVSRKLLSIAKKIGIHLEVVQFRSERATILATADLPDSTVGEIFDLVAMYCYDEEPYLEIVISNGDKYTRGVPPPESIETASNTGQYL